MANEKKIQVAIIVDDENKCEYVAKVKMVNEREYAKLINEMIAKKEKRSKDLFNIVYEIYELKIEIAKLKEEIKVLKGE